MTTLRIVSLESCLLIILTASPALAGNRQVQFRGLIAGFPKQEGLQQLDIRGRPRPEFRPPNRGVPGRREGGGRVPSCRPAKQVPFTLLMPPTNVGLTTSGHPTFFWATGYKQPTEILLVDAETQAIVWQQVVVATAAGIASIQLPANIPELALDKTYGWYVTVQCNPLDPSSNPVLSSYVTRIQADADLSRQLQKAPPEQHPSVYARAGLWFDALATLAGLRQAQPEKQEYIADWKILLESVELAALVNQPLVKVTLPPSQSPPPASPQSRPTKPQGSRSPELRPAGRPAPLR